MLLLESATPPAPVSLGAVLFSRSGRLPVRITMLDDDRATLRSPIRPDPHSFAILVRNGVKLPAVIAWAEGDMLGLSFEAPLPADRRGETFRGGRA